MTIKTGIVSLEGKILYTSVIETEKINPKIQIKKLADDILKLLNEKGIKKEEIIGIGVGCPGAINSKLGKVHYSSNLKWTDFPLKDLLEEYTGIKVRIANDADAATIGEIIFGVAKEYSNVILLTIGTGIGGGIVIDKKLYLGTNGVVAELGHITLRTGGLECGCGRRGCWETYSSATGLTNLTREKINELMAEGVTVLLVSHSISQVKKICDKCIWIDNGKIVMEGPADEVCDAYVSNANKDKKKKKKKKKKK